MKTTLYIFDRLHDLNKFTSTVRNYLSSINCLQSTVYYRMYTTRGSKLLFYVNDKTVIRFTNYNLVDKCIVINSELDNDLKNELISNHSNIKFENLVLDFDDVNQIQSIIHP